MNEEWRCGLVLGKLIFSAGAILLHQWTEKSTYKLQPWRINAFSLTESTLTSQKTDERGLIYYTSQFLTYVLSVVIFA